MSLLSLRKHNLQSETVKRLRHKTRQLNAEQFIDEAVSYANGQGDNVIAFQSSHLDDMQQSEQVLSEHVLKKQADNDTSNDIEKDKVPYRRSTFTLSEPCIASLNKHAKTQQCAKSHLIRMLIRQFDELTPTEQQAVLTQQKD